MEPKQLIEILHVAERLKSTLRHCVTSAGRPESVAEHSWRLALMALLIGGEFPGVDRDKVIRMCLIHDLGEAFTGDVPCFEKTAAHRTDEHEQLLRWIRSFPADQQEEWVALFDEMQRQETSEARLYKALDRLEAVLQHDEADIVSWLPLEYELQLTYGAENVAYSPYLQALKAELDAITREKIAAEALRGSGL